MRNFIITLFTIIVASSCYNDVVDNEARYIPNFRNFSMNKIVGYGPIKKCTEYFYYDNIYEEYGEVALGKPDFFYAYTFNTGGKLIESDFNGYGRHTYEWIDNTCIYNCYDDNKKLSERIVSCYNNEDRIVRQEMYNEHRQLIHLYTYKYDELGTEIEMCDSVTNEIIYKNTIKYEYDDQHRVIRKEYIINPDRKKQSFSYITENIHTPLHIYQYNADSENLLVYDSQNTIVQKKVTTKDYIIDSLFSKGVIDKVEKYDIKLNLLEEQSWYVYNGQNILSTERTYKYVFDDRGNWIRKETYYTNKEIPSSIVIREIEYY